jgi:hypothetical protein
MAVKQLRCAWRPDGEPGQDVTEAVAEEFGADYARNGIRIGHWHQKPREGEALIAQVRVRANDPLIPVFQRK